MSSTRELRKAIKTSKIKSIKKLGIQSVTNLKVSKNHTFINKCNIPTHNCDGLTPQAQFPMRGIMESVGDHVRFIASANYPNKIIPALLSRFQHFHFDALNEEEFISRLIFILDKENIKYNVDDLLPLYQLAYPDLRKAINLLEQNTRNGEFHSIDETTSTKDYLIDMIPLFKEGRYIEARKLICSQARAEDYDDIYRFLYTNLDLFSSDEAVQSEAIIYIAQGLRNHALVSDPEINLAATMVQLSKLK